MFALLVTLVDLMPSPRTPGGRLLAAAVLRRTGDPDRAEAVVARTGVIIGWSLIVLGVAATFLAGLVGLFAVLLGWFALGTSRLAQAQQRTTAAFEGVFVRDVMTPAPATLSAWRTVASALDDVVLPSRQSVFGVQDFDGPLAGVALLRDLAAVPMDDRSLARVGRVTIPLEAVATARPDEPLTEAMTRLTQRPAAGCIVVLDDDPDGRVRMVGVVGPAEFTHAVETAPLRGRTIVPTGLGPFSR
jgi:CBS domain-containing protein